MATIKDVAREAGVSIATVSATLNKTKFVSENLQQRVYTAVKKVGYTPSLAAQSLKKGISRIIGLILPDITNPFFAVLARAVEEASSQHGYTVLLCNSDQDQKKEREFLKLLKTHHMAGLIIAPSSSGKTYGKEIAALVDTPTVLVDRKTTGVTWDSVVSSNKDGARRAITHLIECGHHDIAGIFGLAHVSTVSDRLKGYKEAMTVAGLPLKPQYIARDCDTPEKARLASQAMLNLLERPTAFFASNNKILRGILSAVRNHGLACPQDVSITGFDGMDWADMLDPPMTTVEQDAAEMGAKALELLIKRMEGYSGPVKNHVLPTQFLVRRSSAPPKNASPLAGVPKTYPALDDD